MGVLKNVILIHPTGFSRYASSTHPHHFDTKGAAGFQLEFSVFGGFFAAPLGAVWLKTQATLVQKPNFFESAPVSGLVLMFIHDFTNRRSSSNDHLDTLSPPSLLLGLLLG